MEADDEDRDERMVMVARGVLLVDLSVAAREMLVLLGGGGREN